MKRLLVTLAAAAALGGALAGCATPTPYQPNIPGTAQSGGYSEVRIEPNRFRVTFSGNSLTSRQTVESYLLYRSAELTVAQGYDWFEAADRHTDKRTDYYASPDPFYASPYYHTWGYGFRPSWRYYRGGFGWRTWDPWGRDPFWGGMDIQQVNQYQATAEIVLGRGAKPNNPSAFDARAVLNSLGPSIVRPKA
jgi:hypothetical protein